MAAVERFHANEATAYVTLIPCLVVCHVDQSTALAAAVSVAARQSQDPNHNAGDHDGQRQYLDL